MEPFDTNNDRFGDKIPHQLILSFSKLESIDLLFFLQLRRTENE